MLFQIEQISDKQLNLVVELLKSAAEWLEQKGRLQRVGNTSLETFEKWQRTACNYGVFNESGLVGIFSLPVENFQDWPEFSEAAPAVWLRALATHPTYRGQGVGEFAVKSALDIAGADKPVYLDCVSDFLPEYYGRLGFQKLAEQERKFEKEGRLAITLMVHRNNGLDR